MFPKLRILAEARYHWLAYLYDEGMMGRALVTWISKQTTLLGTRKAQNKHPVNRTSCKLSSNQIAKAGIWSASRRDHRGMRGSVTQITIWGYKALQRDLRSARDDRF